MSSYLSPQSWPNCAILPQSAQPRHKPWAQNQGAFHKASGNDHRCFLFYLTGLKSTVCEWKTGWVGLAQTKLTSKIEGHGWVTQSLLSCRVEWLALVRECRFCLMRKRKAWLSWWRMNCVLICIRSRSRWLSCKTRCFSSILSSSPVKFDFEPSSL